MCKLEKLTISILKNILSVRKYCIRNCLFPYMKMTGLLSFRYGKMSSIMDNKMKNNILPVFFIGIVIMLLFGNTLLPKANTIIYGSDLSDQFYFWKSYFIGSLKNGIVPFWNPYSFSGTPFLAHPSTAAFYPFNLVFLLLPLSFAFSVFLYSHLVLAGVGMYWYMRKKSDELSSLIASLVFSLSGFFAVRIYAGHIDIISTAVWIPWVFCSVS